MNFGRDVALRTRSHCALDWFLGPFLISRCIFHNVKGREGGDGMQNAGGLRDGAFILHRLRGHRRIRI